MRDNQVRGQCGTTVSMWGTLRHAHSSVQVWLSAARCYLHAWQQGMQQQVPCHALQERVLSADLPWQKAAMTAADSQHSDMRSRCLRCKAKISLKGLLRAQAATSTGTPKTVRHDQSAGSISTGTCLGSCLSKADFWKVHGVWHGRHSCSCHALIWGSLIGPQAIPGS